MKNVTLLFLLLGAFAAGCGQTVYKTASGAATGAGDDDDSQTPAAEDDGGDGEGDDAGTSNPKGGDAGHTSSTADAGHSGGNDAGSHDAAAPVVPTFTTLYTTYFAAGSLGGCGGSGCHATTKGGVRCSSQSLCYSTLVSSGLVDTSNPAGSPLGDPSQTPLAWYGSGGSMPPHASANTKAAADITAWLKAGAKNN